LRGGAEHLYNYTHMKPFNLFATLRSIVFALVLAVGLSYAYAWTGPAGVAPTNNTPPPINQGGDVQTKSGQFWSTTGIGTDGGVYATGVGSFGKAQLNDVVVEGTACAPDGTLSRDTAGLVLSCQSGVWAKAGGGGSGSTVALYCLSTAAAQSLGARIHNGGYWSSSNSYSGLSGSNGWFRYTGVYAGGNFWGTGTGFVWDGGQVSGTWPVQVSGSVSPGDIKLANGTSC